MPKQDYKLPSLNAKNLRTVLKLTQFDKVTPCQINERGSERQKSEHRRRQERSERQKSNF